MPAKILLIQVLSSQVLIKVFFPLRKNVLPSIRHCTKQALAWRKIALQITIFDFVGVFSLSPMVKVKANISTGTRWDSWLKWRNYLRGQWHRRYCVTGASTNQGCYMVFKSTRRSCYTMARCQRSDSGWSWIFQITCVISHSHEGQISDDHGHVHDNRSQLWLVGLTRKRATIVLVG